MTGYNDISRFNDYLVDNRVRRLTVIEYCRRGGIWSEKTGEIMRHPEFGGGYSTTTVRFRLHQNPEDPFDRTIEIFLMCEYDDRISFELSEDGAKGVLRGFDHDGYKVDIVAHARTY